MIKRGRAKPLWHGHPWLYSGAVERLEGSCEPGDVVDVVDHDGKLLGRGFYNPRSQIVCRLATRNPDETIDTSWIMQRLHDAKAVRARLGLPNERTNAYRLVNSEGDGLPGVIIDVYGEIVAVQFTALGLQKRTEDLCLALEAKLRPRAIVEVGGQAFAEAEGFEARVGPLRGEPPATVVCRENGVEYEADLIGGQKTGLYLDQRENRGLFAEMARDARVLDVFSYTGGFALHAARAGARAVTAVDVSGRAVARARENAQRNQVAIQCIESDAFHYLEAAEPRKFDLVCVDPPKFARARKDLDAAIKGYRRLNTLALQAVAPGGVLVTCSCSQLVGVEDLERAVAGAAMDAKRTVRLLRVTFQASDHTVPLAFPEGRYLKCLWLAVA